MSATKPKFVVALFVGLVICMPTADARITRIVIDRVESPTFGGTSFGNVGQYEKLIGRAYGELDPSDELNSSIVYINKAPLNSAKRVEYSIDVFILKPIDMRRGNRTLLYDVVNRGDTRALAVFHVGASASNDPTSEKDAGDGFLMKQGYTMVASGWQGDVPAGGNRLVGYFPVATETGRRPITKLITAEFVFTKAAHTVGVGYEGGTNMRPYPAVLDAVSQARLLRRTAALAPRELIPNSEWSFGKCPDGKNPTPSNVDVCYPAGFSPNYLYELVYVAQDPLVMGIGFAATRDLVSFLRYERSATNPLSAKGEAKADADPLRWAIGFGRSQSGRYIKDFVYQGFNLDEGKRVVFDGTLPLISGSRLTFTNAEFAMPGRAPGNAVESHFYRGDEFPHSYAIVYDPISKKRDGWLARCTIQRSCPKIMHWDSGHEPWSGARNSLLVTDGFGKSNLPVPENVRLYYFASTQHVPTLKPDYGICKHLSNPNPYRETVRALLVAMQAWIVEGKPPPPSRFPSVADGTLVPPVPESGFGFPKIPGVAYTGKHSELHIKNFSVQPPQNIPGTSYTVLVPKVDADGNDIGGVRSVAVQVPLATYTGWNQRREGLMENELCGNWGAHFPFAKTAAERGNDARPSLQERYGSQAGYVAKVEEAAQKLVTEGFLLPEDAARIVEEARRRDLGF
jgi:Alpha/beta hydrolase domain